MIVGHAAILGTLGNQAVVDGTKTSHLVRSLDGGTRSQCGRHSGRAGTEFLRNPHKHRTASTMIPGIIGDQIDAHGRGSKFTLVVELEHLRRGGKHLDRILVENGLILELEFWRLVDEDAAHVETRIVGPFGTIDQRTALHADTSQIGLDLGICLHDASLHIEVDLHLVALLPLAGNDGIAIAEIGIADGIIDAIDLQTVAESLVVAVLIEVAWDHLIAHPTRDADVEGKVATTLLHGQHDIAIVGIGGLLLQGEDTLADLQGCRIAHKEIHKDIVVLHGIDIARERRDETADVGRTAGAAEPSLTLMLTDGLERIGIEERTTIERHARDQTVVERAFEHIVILRLTMEQEETIVDIDVADGRTGLAIGTHVGQLVVFAESLTTGSGTDAARDVVFLLDNIVPDAVDGVDIGGVARKGSHIGHTRIHIGGTHGVTYSLVLLYDGLVSLRILVGAGGVATLVEEELRLLEILGLTRHKVKFCQSHLGNLMTGHTHLLIGTFANLAANAVGVGTRDVEERGLARGLIVGDGTLDHMTEIVELVAQILDEVPTMFACPLVRMQGIHGARSVEIAIGFLGCLHDGDDTVHIDLSRDHVGAAMTIDGELEVGESLQKVGTAFDGLIDIGIVEGKASDMHRVGIDTLQMLGGNLEVAVTSRLLAFGESERHGHLAAGVETLAPEGVGRDLHTGERNRVDGIATTLGLCQHGKGGKGGKGKKFAHIIVF